MNHTMYSGPVWVLFQSLSHLGALEGESISVRADAPDKSMVLFVKTNDSSIFRAQAQVLGSPVVMALAEYTCRELLNLRLDSLEDFVEHFVKRASLDLKLSPHEAHLAHWVGSILQSLLYSEGNKSND